METSKEVGALQVTRWSFQVNPLSAFRRLGFSGRSRSRQCWTNSTWGQNNMTWESYLSLKLWMLNKGELQDDTGSLLLRCFIQQDCPHECWFNDLTSFSKPCLKTGPTHATADHHLMRSAGCRNNAIAMVRTSLFVFRCRWRFFTNF